MAGVMSSGLKDYRVQVLVIVSVSCPLAKYSSFKPLLSNAEYKIMTPKLPDMCMYINILYGWWSGGVLSTMDWYFVQNEYSCLRTCDKLSQLFKLVLFICSLFVCMILYRCSKEKFRLGHSQELKVCVTAVSLPSFFDLCFTNLHLTNFIFVSFYYSTNTVQRRLMPVFLRRTGIQSK